MRYSTFDKIDVTTFAPDKCRIEIVWNSGKAYPNKPWVSYVQLVCLRPVAVPPITIILKTLHTHIGQATDYNVCVACVRGDTALHAT